MRAAEKVSAKQRRHSQMYCEQFNRRRRVVQRSNGRVLQRPGRLREFMRHHRINDSDAVASASVGQRSKAQIVAAVESGSDRRHPQLV